MVFRKSIFSALTILGVCGTLASVAGCAVEADSSMLMEKQQPLTIAQGGILGFESLSEWSAGRVNLSLNGNATEGSSSLAVESYGWTEIKSARMSSLGSVGDSISFDVLVPQSFSWGEIALKVNIPSMGVHGQQIGVQSLSSLPVGGFERVEFSIPSALKAQLEGVYDDLEFRIALNHQFGWSPASFLIDNLNVGGGSALPPVDLVMTGTGNFVVGRNPSVAGYHKTRIGADLSLQNNTGESVTVDKELTLFVSPGGHATTVGVSTSSSTSLFWSSLDATNRPVDVSVAVGGWTWSGPLTHIVHRVSGTTSSGQPVSATAAIPLLTSGSSPPAELGEIGDVFVGVMGPLRVFELTNGKRWLDFTGSVVDMTNTSGLSLPSVTGRILDAEGNVVADLQTTVRSVNLALAISPSSAPSPARQFRAWAQIPDDVSPESVELNVEQLGLASGDVTLTKLVALDQSIPVIDVEAPVSGLWVWENGPGKRGEWHAHAQSPEGRWGYDMTMNQLVDGDLQTYSSAPAVNSSYFCWAEPIKAVLDGTVVYAFDGTVDNAGDQRDNMVRNNEIIIEHAGNVFSRYVHMRWDSATVSVGDVVSAGTPLAVVGNAGFSSEPHLHIQMYTFDATGRLSALPFSINDLTMVVGPNAHIPVYGVPASGSRLALP